MKIIKILVFLIVMSLNLNVKAFAECAISAKSAVVIDSVSREVLFEKDAHTKRGMASTTKIMTALIALEMLDGKDIVSISSFASGTEGSSIWLSAGEKMSVENLLYGLMLSSGNDAATALAEHTSGSVEAFTQLMNLKAKDFGCTNTNFTNPHGLPDENHYTTAYELAIISSYAMENDSFCEIVRTKNKQIPWEGHEWNRSLQNHNKLLKMKDYFTGIKTGYTKKDGRCLVSSAESDGRKIIIVTLSAPDDWNDHIRLSEFVFDKYKPYKLVKEGDRAVVKTDPSKRFGDIHTVYAEDLTLTLKEGNHDKITSKTEFSINFPVKRGDRVGKCRFFYQDRMIAAVDIIADNNSVYKNDFFTVFKELAKGLVYR